LPGFDRLGGREVTGNSPVPVVAHNLPRSPGALQKCLARGAEPAMSIEDQYAAGSPLSVGLLTTFLKEAPIGRFKLMFFGGIGCMNHLS
jgi:hypothetical protein